MKVGVVGRTGAGKSSLFQALFQLEEWDCRSSIVIDGIGILKSDSLLFAAHLHHPQVFSPLRRHREVQFGSLQAILYLRTVERPLMCSSNKEGPIPKQLPAACFGRPALFSVRQKQLIWLVRTILRRNKIWS